MRAIAKEAGWVRWVGFVCIASMCTGCSMMDMMSDDPYVRKRASVKRMKDPQRLMHVALGVGDYYYELRAEAARKLTDPVLLARVAAEAEPDIVRQAAREQLTAVRSATVRKTTDQALLGILAVQDDDSAVRQIAVENLSDQVLLAKVANEDPDSDVRLQAIASLTDRALLSQFAGERDSHIGEFARFRLFLTASPIENLVGVTKVSVKRKILEQEYQVGVFIRPRSPSSLSDFAVMVEIVTPMVARSNGGRSAATPP